MTAQSPPAKADLSFERMTIFCRDMEASLGFYRDVIGLVVVEDKSIEGAAAGAMVQLPACKMRIVFLAPDMDAPMVLGLFEISGTPMETLAAPKGRPSYGQTSLLLRTTEFDAVCARMAAADVPMLTPPFKYPKRNSSPRSPSGLYREVIAYDPDGVLFAVWQLDPLPEDGAA